MLNHCYPFNPPAIASYGLYTFTSGSGVEYEVRFGRKQNDILYATIVFGVTNEEYEGEEYVLTAKNEFYPVMRTIEAIIHDFCNKNPNIHGFEFSGEPVDENEPEESVTKRTRVYKRYAQQIFPNNKWQVSSDGNRVIIERKRA